MRYWKITFAVIDVEDPVVCYAPIKLSKRFATTLMREGVKIQYRVKSKDVILMDAVEDHGLKGN